jgi:DNA-binding transcriptional LysR family regulator
VNGFDIEAVVAFSRVVEHGSFTAAANASGIPKSTLSRRVAELEEQLGVRLLNRSSRRVALTEAGTGFHERVSAALSQVEHAVREVADQQERPRGRVRISAPFDVALDIAALLPKLLDRHPELNVVLDVSQRHVDLVAEGFDLAVRGGAIRDPELVVRRLADSCSVVVASPAYLARRGAPSTVAELASHQVVVLGSSDTAEWVFVNGEQRVHVELKAHIAVNELHTLAEAVLAGGGIGCLPHFTVAAELASGRLAHLLPEWQGPRGGLSIVVPSARHLPAKVRVLRDFLLEQLPQAVGGGARVGPSSSRPRA